VSHPLLEAILTHLRSEQRPLHRESMIDELMRLAAAAPEDYPRATKLEWKYALDQLVLDGLVSSSGERVAIIRQQQAGRDEPGLLF
jgi:Tfp pilus assembly protein PilP